MRFISIERTKQNGGGGAKNKWLATKSDTVTYENPTRLYTSNTRAILVIRIMAIAVEP